MNANIITTDFRENFENLTHAELLATFVEMKKANVQLMQESATLTHALAQQNSEINDLQNERDDDMERIDFLCDMMTDLEEKRSLLEASLKGSIPVKYFVGSEKAANQDNFSILRTN